MRYYLCFCIIQRGLLQIWTVSRRWWCLWLNSMISSAGAALSLCWKGRQEGNSSMRLSRQSLVCVCCWKIFKIIRCFFVLKQLPPFRKNPQSWGQNLPFYFCCILSSFWAQFFSCSSQYLISSCSSTQSHSFYGGSMRAFRNFSRFSTSKAIASQALCFSRSYFWLWWKLQPQQYYSSGKPVRKYRKPSPHHRFWFLFDLTFSSLPHLTQSSCKMPFH